MKKLMFAGLLLATLTPSFASAQSSFDGTWKADLSTLQLPTKPDVYVLQDGMYKCTSCVPVVSVKADGQDHKIAGNPYMDTVSIKVVDDQTILETDKKGGKTVGTSKSTVSKDGKTLTFEFTDSSDTNADPVTGKGTEARVAPSPDGAHAISGSWRTTKLSNLSENAMTVTYRTTGDSLSMTAPTGQSYTAKLDGTEAPFNGDPGVSTVSVESTSPNVITETDKRGPKTVTVTHMTVSADGKTMKVTSTNVMQGTTFHYVLVKQ